MSRNSDGTFGKGNKFGKKDFTKELAQHMVSSEMWYISKMIADMPFCELEEFLNQNKKGLSLMSMKLIEKMKKGDTKTIQWFVEMLIGRAPQQVTHSTPTGKTFNLSYTRNGNN